MDRCLQRYFVDLYGEHERRAERDSDFHFQQCVRSNEFVNYLGHSRCQLYRNWVYHEYCAELHMSNRNINPCRVW
jgi:hypothetical protein